MGQTSRNNCSVVVRHGRTRSKMRGTVLRIGKQKRRRNYTNVLIFVSTISKSKGRSGKIDVNCLKFAPICFFSKKKKCLYLARIGRPDILYGQSINWNDLSQNGLKHVTDDWHDQFLAFTTDFRQHCHGVMRLSSVGTITDTPFSPLSGIHVKPKLHRRRRRIYESLQNTVAEAKRCSHRLNAKEVLITHKDGEFVFLVADGSAKLSGRDYEFQEPTLRR